MKKYIDKFWIWKSKLNACWRLLTQSKTTTWVVLFDEFDKDGKRTMTYQVEQTANAASVYNLLQSALTYTGGFVVRGLKKDINPLAVEIVEKNMAASKECTEMLQKMMKVAEGDIKTISELVKQK